MENQEQVHELLTAFEKKPTPDIPDALEEYLRYVAKTGKITPQHSTTEGSCSLFSHVPMPLAHSHEVLEVAERLKGGIPRVWSKKILSNNQKTTLVPEKVLANAVH